MNTTPAEFDCKTILEMMQETPDAGAVIIGMIEELEDADQNCIRKARELHDRATAAA